MIQPHQHPQSQLSLQSINCSSLSLKCLTCFDEEYQFQAAHFSIAIYTRGYLLIKYYDIYSNHKYWNP